VHVSQFLPLQQTANWLNSPQTGPLISFFRPKKNRVSLSSWISFFYYYEYFSICSWCSCLSPLSLPPGYISAFWGRVSGDLLICSWDRENSQDTCSLEIKKVQIIKTAGKAQSSSSSLPPLWGIPSIFHLLLANERRLKRGKPGK